MTLLVAAIMVPDVPEILTVNASLAVVALFLVVAGLVAHGDRILPSWRRLLYAFAFQQAVLVYYSVELLDQGVPADPRPWRIYALSLSLVVIVAAALWAAWSHGRIRRNVAGRE